MMVVACFTAQDPVRQTAERKEHGSLTNSVMSPREREQSDGFQQKSPNTFSSDRPLWLHYNSVYVPAMVDPLLLSRELEKTVVSKVLYKMIIIQNTDNEVLKQYGHNENIPSPHPSLTVQIVTTGQDMGYYIRMLIKPRDVPRRSDQEIQSSVSGGLIYTWQNN